MTPTLNPPPATNLGVRLFTVADLAALPHELPSGSVRWELDCGRLVAMVLPARGHSRTSLRFGHHLFVQGEQRGHGEAGDAVGVVLRRNPDTVRGPDAYFIRASRLPPRVSPEGFLETMPDLVVEVRSPNDTLAGLQRKADEYLAAGVAVVWVVNPVGREVIESRQGGQRRVFAEDDTLVLDEVIPGFSLPVRDVFA